MDQKLCELQMATSEKDAILPSEDKEEKGSSIAGTTFNYVNGVIGSGVIGIPYAIKASGFGFGIFLLVFIAVVSDYSMILVIQNGEIANVNTYQDVVTSAFGKFGLWWITFMQFIFPIVAMTSYNVIVGDTVTSFIIEAFHANKDSAFARREIIILLATICGTLPLSLYKNIGRLSKVSFISLVSVLFIIISIMIRIPHYLTMESPTEDAWTFMKLGGTAESISIMSSAFMCHHVAFIFYRSMENPTLQRWQQTSHISMGVSWLGMTTLAVGGYVTFTGRTEGDLLNNYCWSDDLMNVARLMYALTVVLTFPIECFVAREVVCTLIGKVVDDMSEKMLNIQHFVVTILLVIVAFVLSLSTDCLAKVLSINGLVTAIPLAFMAPGLCSLKLQKEPIMSRASIGPLTVVTFSVVVLSMGAVEIALKGLGTCVHNEEMPYCDVHPANTTLYDRTTDFGMT